MSTLRFTLLLLLLTISRSIQKSSLESATYRAAVIEFEAVQYYNDSEKTLNDNAKKIVECIQIAAEKDVDIVVLPELSLTGLLLRDRSDVLSRSTLVPDPYQNYAPCTDISIPVRKVTKGQKVNEEYNNRRIGSLAWTSKARSC